MYRNRHHFIASKYNSKSCDLCKKKKKKKNFKRIFEVNFSKGFVCQMSSCSGGNSRCNPSLMITQDNCERWWAMITCIWAKRKGVTISWTRQKFSCFELKTFSVTVHRVTHTYAITASVTRSKLAQVIKMVPNRAQTKISQCLWSWVVFLSHSASFTICLFSFVHTVQSDVMNAHLV